jgi:hypothetical protein
MRLAAPCLWWIRPWTESFIYHIYSFAIKVWLNSLVITQLIAARLVEHRNKSLAKQIVLCCNTKILKLNHVVIAVNDGN